MKEFTYVVSMTLYGTVTVEAENETDAREKAKLCLDYEDANWCDRDFYLGEVLNETEVED